MRGPHVAHLEREADAGAPPPSLSTSLGARAQGAPAESIPDLGEASQARDLPWETSRGVSIEGFCKGLREGLRSNLYGKQGKTPRRPFNRDPLRPSGVDIFYEGYAARRPC